MFVWLIQWVCINIGEKKNKQNCSDWCATKQHDVSWFSLVWFLILWCTCFMLYSFLFLYFFGTDKKQDSDSCWNKNLFNMSLAAFLSFPPCRLPLPPPLHSPQQPPSTATNKKQNSAWLWTQLLVHAKHGGSIIEPNAKERYLKYLQLKCTATSTGELNMTFSEPFECTCPTAVLRDMFFVTNKAINLQITHGARAPGPRIQRWLF